MSTTTINPLTRINRLARATALENELLTKGDTPRAARLADKVFGGEGWNWASLFYRTALLTGTWERYRN